jgi:hypothetical protein
MIYSILKKKVGENARSMRIYSLYIDLHACKPSFRLGVIGLIDAATAIKVSSFKVMHPKEIFVGIP